MKRRRSAKSPLTWQTNRTFLGSTAIPFSWTMAVPFPGCLSAIMRQPFTFGAAATRSRTTGKSDLSPSALTVSSRTPFTLSTLTSQVSPPFTSWSRFSSSSGAGVELLFSTNQDQNFAWGELATSLPEGAPLLQPMAHIAANPRNLLWLMASRASSLPGPRPSSARRSRGPARRRPAEFR